jgi:hypothetical protein
VAEHRAAERVGDEPDAEGANESRVPMNGVTSGNLALGLASVPPMVNRIHLDFLLGRVGAVTLALVARSGALGPIATRIQLDRRLVTQRSAPAVTNRHNPARAAENY